MISLVKKVGIKRIDTEFRETERERVGAYQRSSRYYLSLIEFCMEKKNRSLYPENFKLSLKHLPPIDPSITTPAFSKAKDHEKPNWRAAKARPKERIIEEDSAVAEEGLLEVGDINNDASLCSTKYVDPNSTTPLDKKSDEMGVDVGDFQCTNSKHEGAKNKVSAKSQLHEVCAVNRWKLPLYECCKEEGPCHMKLFTFKVTVEVESPNIILECFSAPQSKKKTAAEHAAEAALWYLNFLGYFPIKK